MVKTQIYLKDDILMSFSGSVILQRLSDGRIASPEYITNCILSSGLRSIVEESIFGGGLTTG